MYAAGPAEHTKDFFILNQLIGISRPAEHQVALINKQEKIGFANIGELFLSSTVVGRFAFLSNKCGATREKEQKVFRDMFGEDEEAGKTTIDIKICILD